MNDCKFLVFSILVTLGSTSGCGSDEPTSCSTSDDCFKGQICAKEQCVVASDNQNNTGNNANNTGNNQNNTSNNQNNTANNENNTSNGCYVDPFSVECEDDGNDSLSDYIDALETQGCDNNDDFTPGSAVVNGHMCAQESIDKFSPVLIGCRDRSYIAEAIFKPDKVCFDRYTVWMSAQGKSCENQDESPDVECIQDEDGTLTGRFIIRDSRSVENLRITIDKGENTDVDFNYELTVNIR